MGQQRDADDRIALRKLHAAHARGFAPLEDADIGDGEADAAPVARRQQNVIGIAA